MSGTGDRSIQLARLAYRMCSLNYCKLDSDHAALCAAALAWADIDEPLSP
jgi:hypothetical protein